MFRELRSQRCLRNSTSRSAGKYAEAYSDNAPRSLTARFASTLRVLRIPGIVVLTSGLLKMNRSANSGSVIPPFAILSCADSGNNGFSASTRFKVSCNFPPEKYELRQSPSAHLLEAVSVPVSEPSSNGTRAITATFFSRPAGNNSSSGFWSKMLYTTWTESTRPARTAFTPFHGCQRFKLIPTAHTFPVAFNFSIACAIPRIFEPAVVPGMQLDQIQGFESQIPQTFFDVFRDVLWWIIFVQPGICRRRPRLIFGRHFCRNK